MYVGDIGSHFVQLFKRSDIGLALLMCRGCVADLLLFFEADMDWEGRLSRETTRPHQGSTCSVAEETAGAGWKAGVERGGRLEIRVSREPLGMWK